MECFSSRLRAICCAAAILGGGQLGADELDERVKAFQDAALPHIQQLREDAAQASPTAKQRAVHQAELLAQLSAVSSGQPEAVLRKLDEVRNHPGVPPTLKTLLDDLARDLPKLAEQRMDRQLAEIDRLVKDAASACLAAKTESELDPLLRELSRAARVPRGESATSERQQRAQRRLQAATHTVSMWQDYLAHVTIGNPAGAAATLQRLLQSTDYPIIPRAEIEKRLASLQSIRIPRTEQLAAVKRVRNIEDLDAALAEIRRLSAPDRNALDANVVPFERLASALAAARAGFVAEAFQAVSTGDRLSGGSLGPEWDAELSRLRGLLLLKVLPRYLELREASAPKEAENVSEYLLRLIEELVKQRRFGEAIRALETYRNVAFAGTTQPPPWIAADVEGLRTFAAADRLASAGSWAEAINSFRRAAEISGKFTPASEAAQRLSELSQAHPEEAKNAARLAEIETTYQRLSRELANDSARALEARMPPDMRARMRPPGYPSP